MKAVILAAGRGTRMGKLTENTPKPLLEVRGRPILEHKLNSLPDSIDEVIVVVSYLGDKIRNYFGPSFNGKKIKYVDQNIFPGTAGALWQVRDLLTGKFLVINGDDFYRVEDLERCLKYDLCMGLSEKDGVDESYLSIELDEEGAVKDWGFDKNDTKLLINGVYVLDDRIFDYKPELIKKEEFGLPHTILKMSREHPVKGVVMDYWHSLNTPEDIKKFEEND